MTLCTIILTHNEAKQVATAIKSVRFADQILVIDDYSSDATPTIASKTGATVIRHHLQTDFASQRNFALSHSKCTWTLFIDADEIVSPQLHQEIRSTLTSNPTLNGYRLRRLDIFLGQVLHHGETSRVRLLRLARTTAGTWHRPVHETWHIPGPTATLRHPLLHRPHSSIESFIADINTYTSIEAIHRHQPLSITLIQALFFPPAKFIYNYLFLLGILDGFPGFIMAFIMSLHSLTVRIKQYEKHSP